MSKTLADVCWFLVGFASLVVQCWVGDAPHRWLRVKRKADGL